MLPANRNKLTMGILGKLKQGGMPAVSGTQPPAANPNPMAPINLTGAADSTTPDESEQSQEGTPNDLLPLEKKLRNGKKQPMQP